MPHIQPLSAGPDDENGGAGGGNDPHDPQEDPDADMTDEG